MFPFLLEILLSGWLEDSWLCRLYLLVQACPPQGFPFFGLPPSMLAQLSLQHLQPQVAL